MITISAVIEKEVKVEHKLAIQIPLHCFVLFIHSTQC